MAERTLRDTLILRSTFFLKKETIEHDRELIEKQIRKADGVVIIPNCYEVMFCPEGTDVIELYRIGK